MGQLYEANGNVYDVEGGVAHPANIVAKDKVIEIRELESVAVKVDKNDVVLPSEARPVTIDEAVAKFNISEKNPLKFDADAHEACFEKEADASDEAAAKEAVSEAEAVVEPSEEAVGDNDTNGAEAKPVEKTPKKSSKE